MDIVQESVQRILSEHSHDWYNYHLHLTHMSDEEYRGIIILKGYYLI